MLSKKAPDNSNYRYHLALTYQNLNDSARARAELEKAISIDPKSPIAEESAPRFESTDR